MSNVKDYWYRHPTQLRLFAAVILVFMPLFMLIFYTVENFYAIVKEVSLAYKTYWRVLMKGRDA